MSEFETLKNDAEHLAQQHPQQVQEGEREIEKEVGLGQQGQDQQQGQAQSGPAQQQGQSAPNSASGGEPGQGSAGR